MQNEAGILLDRALLGCTIFVVGGNHGDGLNPDSFSGSLPSADFKSERSFAVAICYVISTTNSERREEGEA